MLRRTGWKAAVAALGALLVSVTLTAGAASGQEPTGREPVVQELAGQESVGQKPAGRVPDKVAFDRLLRQQANAWVHESGAEFAATFHQDGDVVTFNGDHLRGRAEIARGMQYYFDKYIENTTFRTLSEQIRYLEPDVAVVIRTSCLITAPATTCRADSTSINTNILQKKQGRWLQASFQNTRVEPLP